MILNKIISSENPYVGAASRVLILSRVFDVVFGKYFLNYFLLVALFEFFFFNQAWMLNCSECHLFFYCDNYMNSSF